MSVYSVELLFAADNHEHAELWRQNIQALVDAAFPKALLVDGPFLRARVEEVLEAIGEGEDE